MTAEELTKELDALYTAYLESLEPVFERVREEVVRPMVKQFGDFSSGMGNWIFENQTFFMDHPILDMEMEGVRGQIVGAMLGDVTL